MKKIYVVRKYVLAHSAQEAIKLEKKQQVDDVWVDDQTQKMYFEEILKTQGGYKLK